jgi:histidinol-phosphatase (PHP family)
VAVEVNTAGLRKPCQELYPAQELLDELFAAGVPVTVGSDAHRPSEVGAGWNEARAALMAAGYRSVLVFRQRVPEEVPLDGL